MRKIIILVFLNLLSYFSFSQYTSQVEAFVTELKPSLVGEDHTGEGMLETLNDGSIIHIFRLDPGLAGGHIGNASRIVKRYSYDDGASWTEPETIYESEYDDRNVHGGLVEGFRLLVFFRRYNVTDNTTIDVNLIYSDDNGYSWSEPSIINTIGLSSASHKLLNVPTKGYMNAFGKLYYIETRFSRHGIYWDSIAYSWNYLDSLKYSVGEPSFAYIENGLMLGLFRNTVGNYGSSYLFVKSNDYGETWTEPMPTNIADSFYCPSPLIFYNDEHKDIWSIASDRRGLIDPNYSNLDSEFWIYRNKTSDIIDNAKGFSLFHKIRRPTPNIYRLYGYPCVTKMQNGNYLVIVSDAIKKYNGLEDSDFYQFEIKYSLISSNDREIDSNSLLSQNYPNPATNYTSIDFYKSNSEDGMISIYDLNGNEKMTINFDNYDIGMNSAYLDISDLSSGVYYYTYKANQVETSKKMVLIK